MVRLGHQNNQKKTKKKTQKKKREKHNFMEFPNFRESCDQMLFTSVHTGSTKYIQILQLKKVSCIIFSTNFATG